MRALDTRDGGGALLRTPLYLPLEILRGQAATVRSDIYALGSLLYELSTGAPPYKARSNFVRLTA